MQQEKTIVANSQGATAMPFNSVETPTETLHKTITNFLSFANTSEYSEVNNDLLYIFLEKALKEDYCHEHIHKMVFMITSQSQFLITLKENWENFKKFNTTKN